MRQLGGGKGEGRQHPLPLQVAAYLGRGGNLEEEGF